MANSFPTPLIRTAAQLALGYVRSTAERRASVTLPQQYDPTTPYALLRPEQTILANHRPYLKQVATRLVMVTEYATGDTVAVDSEDLTALTPFLGDAARLVAETGGKGPNPPHRETSPDK